LHVGVARGPGGREGEDPRIGQVGPRLGQRPVHRHHREVVVVQPGATQLAVLDVEQGIHQMQVGPGGRREPDRVAGVAGDARLEEQDVEHDGSLGDRPDATTPPQPRCGGVVRATEAQTRSNRSRSMTWLHAATKSVTNLVLASSLAYTSATARSSEFEPNTRSARVPVQRPSAETNRVLVSSAGFHCVSLSSRLTKKSFVRVPTFSVRTPSEEPSQLAPRTRRPPTSTVISGAVRVSRLARSSSSYSAGSTPRPS